MDLLLADVVSVLVWRVLSRGGYRLCDMLLRYYIIHFPVHCVSKNLRKVDKKYFKSFKILYSGMTEKNRLE
jgi:hypothetical protein